MLLLVVELEPDRHALFLAGHPRRVTFASEIVDVLHRAWRQVDLALGDFELSASRQVDDVLALRSDMPVAETAGRRYTHFDARRLLENVVRLQREIFDVRQAVGAAVNPLDDRRLADALGIDDVEACAQAPRHE